MLMFLANNLAVDHEELSTITVFSNRWTYINLRT